MEVLFLHEMQSPGYYFSPEIQNVTMVSDYGTRFMTHQHQKQGTCLFNISENLQNDRYRIVDNQIFISFSGSLEL